MAAHAGSLKTSFQYGPQHAETRAEILQVLTQFLNGDDVESRVDLSQCIDGKPVSFLPLRSEFPDVEVATRIFLSIFLGRILVFLMISRRLFTFLGSFADIFSCSRWLIMFAPLFGFVRGAGSRFSHSLPTFCRRSDRIHASDEQDHGSFHPYHKPASQLFGLPRSDSLRPIRVNASSIRALSSSEIEAVP